MLGSLQTYFQPLLCMGLLQVWGQQGTWPQPPLEPLLQTRLWTQLEPRMEMQLDP